jgi:predicted nucleic acid-binding protein
MPTVRCARIYGRLRGGSSEAISLSKRNDLWIAAVCIDHEVPLMSNDRGFKQITDLAVIHW